MTLIGKHICEYVAENTRHLAEFLFSSSYTGRTKIDRLLYLAQNCPPLRQVCSTAAAELITSTTTDTALYHRALQIRNTLPDSGEPWITMDKRLPSDEAWIMSTQKSNQDELEKLDLELRHYQNNLIKESVRVSITVLVETLADSDR